MATKKKMLQAAAGQAGGEPGPDITEVFSTYLYTGTGSTQTITNGIDLASEGGLVWQKWRNASSDHWWIDTERGVQKSVSSNNNEAEQNKGSNSLTSFNSNGFDVGSYFGTSDIASWTFRKAPKFFDVVTYSGDGSNSRAISHSLGSIPGMVIIKRLDSATDWMVYHRGVNGGTNPANYYLTLNGPDPAYETASPFNNTVPTSSVFFVGGSANTNHSNGTYVAYLFAHNDGNGGFGPDGDADVIKCGSYTGTGAAGNFIDLGFEPQWLITKSATGSENWIIQDNMRGMTVTGYDWLRANLDDAEVSGALSGGTAAASPTGFVINNGGAGNTSGSTYIYMAIRRGPLAPPESATEVFAIDTANGTSPSPPHFNSGFPVDFEFNRDVASSADWYAGSRLTGSQFLRTNTTDAQQSDNSLLFDYQNGFYNASYTFNTAYSWMWKRAPGFFDVVAYTGTSSSASHTVNHNLGVAPEFVWIKRRNGTSSWRCYHNDGSTERTLYLETTLQGFSNSTLSSVGDTSFVVNGGVLDASATYIMYLFASLDGVSKVGSFTHINGSDTTVDCGFSSGARFVLVKMSSSADNWFIYDTMRGINAGTEPYLTLNTNSNEATGTDQIDPTPSGFVWTSGNNTGDYIFYAIA